MSDDNGRAHVEAGILHFHGREWVATHTTPNILFGESTRLSMPGDPVIEVIPGGISIGFALGAKDKYAGIQEVSVGENKYQLYFVGERVAELVGGAFYTVSYSLVAR